MMSLHAVASSGQALHYFSKDNYYTDDKSLEESEWYGKGASALGYSGKVGREEFFAALDGKFEGQELGRFRMPEHGDEPERVHQPGIDLTFSAPKSVSILAEVGGDSELRRAHEDAVKATLAYIERDLMKTRVRVDGEIEAVNSPSITVAMFRHNTSRDLDPQTHTHAIVMNGTRDEDGKWRSIVNKELYTNQKVIGAVYNAELATRVQRLGYEITVKDKHGNFEVKGLTPDQLEHFSKRRNEIAAAMKERGLDIDNASAHAKEAATLATREKKVDVDHDKLLSEWRGRAREQGIDLERLTGDAREQRRDGGVQRPDAMTGRQAMEFAASHLNEREMVVPKRALLSTALAHGTGRVSGDQVLRAFDKLERDGDLIKLPDGNYTTKKILSSEAWALRQIGEQKMTHQRVAGEAHIADRLNSIEQRDGLRYTTGQREAVTLALASEDRFNAVQGLAGTGKTTMLRAVREIAEEQGVTVRAIAPTGAATKVMAAEVGLETQTVAMFLIRQRQEHRANDPAADDTKAGRAKELWIVDESSFLSQRQMGAIYHHAERADAKVVLLGDTKQLQGVEAGKPFEMGQKEGMATAVMDQINRQKTAPLKEVVAAVTGQDQLAPGDRLAPDAPLHARAAFDAMRKNGMVREVQDRAELRDTIVQTVATMTKAERDRTIVITPYNAERKAINEGVRQSMRAAGEFSTPDVTRDVYEAKGFTKAQIKEAQYYAPGDVVRFGRDYQALGVQKGEYATVKAVDPQIGTVHLSRTTGGEDIAWRPKLNNNVEVYDRITREIAVGDVVRVTRNSETLKNGEVMDVVAIRGDVATVVLRGAHAGQRAELDMAANPHWDHAYARTIHSAQGATEHRTIMHVPVPKTDNSKEDEARLKQMAQVFGDRAGYVGVTRATHELIVFTTDQNRAAQAFAGHQDKTSAVQSQRSGQTPQPAGIVR